MKLTDSYKPRLNLKSITGEQSFFRASDIKERGLSPLSKVGSLVSRRRAVANPPTTPAFVPRRRMKDAGVAPQDTRLTSVDSEKTGLSISKASIAAVTVDEPVVHSKPRRYALGAAVFLIGAVFTYSVLQAIFGEEAFPGVNMPWDSKQKALSKNGASDNASASATDAAKNKGTDAANKVPTDVKAGVPASNTDNVAGSQVVAPTDTTATAPVSAASGSSIVPSTSTNLPAGGTTNLLPSGIPGVTQPITTTIPGQTITIDDKTLLDTSGTSIKLN